MPKISVIMPVYNTPSEYLRASINSILCQTFKDFEFLIIDDGSTDTRTTEIIKSYADKRIKYIRKKHDGIVNTLNTGLDNATGEYIARMDSDDIAMPNRFERQVKYMDEHPDVSLTGTQVLMIPTHRVLRFMTNPRLMDFMTENVIIHPTVMFRRADFQQHNLRYRIEYTDAEDYDLWVRAVKLLKFVNLDEILLHYRLHPASITTVHNQNQNCKAQEIKQNIARFLSDNFDTQTKLFILAQHKPISKNVLYLFFRIPFIRTVQTPTDTRVYLFGIIPILKIKKKV